MVMTIVNALTAVTWRQEGFWQNYRLKDISSSGGVLGNYYDKDNDRVEVDCDCGGCGIKDNGDSGSWWGV